MALFSPLTSCAIRTVNSGGAVIRGPLLLQRSGVGTNGLTLRSGSFAYVPEMIGPVTFADFHRAPYLLGYRIQVELDFSEIAFENNSVNFPSGSYGYALLLNYFADGLRNPTYAALQFNLTNKPGDSFSPLWRGVYPTSPWRPTWASGNQRGGVMTMKVSLEGRDLLTDLNQANDIGTQNW